MSNVKIIRTAQRQREEALQRASGYKARLTHAEDILNALTVRAAEANRHSRSVIYKLGKERRKFIAACIVAGIAIAVAVVK